MIYSLNGIITAKQSAFVVIEANGIGFKVSMSEREAMALPPVGSKAAVFCSFAVKKDGVELYGFAAERELEMFELLTTISGVGPKTAQGIVGAVGTDILLAAVEQKKPDALAEFPGVGKKKAERIILELRDKIKKMRPETAIEFHEGDRDIKDALRGLGYRQSEIDEAVKHIPHDVAGTEERLKAALRSLGKKR